MPWLDHGIHAVPPPHDQLRPVAAAARLVPLPVPLGNGMDAMITSWHDDRENTGLRPAPQSGKSARAARSPQKSFKN